MNKLNNIIYKRPILRRLFYAILVLLNGWKRAAILKKINYFNKQGEKCFFSTVKFGTEPFFIDFGDNVYLATNVRLVTHDMSAQMIRTALSHSKPLFKVGHIKFGSNIFIGSDCTVMPDVNICDNVIVGSGSVITRSITESGIYAGTPPRKLKEFEEYSQALLEYNSGKIWYENDLSNSEILDALINDEF
ncbi:MAG: hypothetical protein KAI89_06070 [Emcibacter sp.]|nr:hypothetical protein [Emcibacter sp.]